MDFIIDIVGGAFFISAYFLLSFTFIPVIPTIILLFVTRRRLVLWIPILIVFVSGFLVLPTKGTGLDEIDDAEVKHFAESKLSFNAWAHDNWTIPTPLYFRIESAGRRSCSGDDDSMYASVVGYSWWLIPTLWLEYDCHGEHFQ